MNKPHSYKCDIWAIGIILYNMLQNGKNPFTGPNQGNLKSSQSEENRKSSIDGVQAG